MQFIGNIKYDIDLINAKQIIVCGAGKNVDNLLDTLKEMKIIDSVCCITDKDLKMIGKKISNIPVNLFEDVIEEFPDADYIVYNKFAREICTNLMNFEIKKIHLLRKY